MGQTYDYLRRLKSFYGLVDALAITTDYFNWRICWLPSSDDVAVSATLGTVPGIHLGGDDSK